ncbi:hypothetical protein [Streptomyces scopuliridis]|uniref:Uncharacterized protein n=1 Tax=Streptomyces scopuliridis TaxID=452529 RepID=A0ACD4ZYX7_9ACTN|nr:hypothetical protein [Streptomyces scopuliridis]WSC03584.1 hypothetical protein OG835_42590 [Streptomyces scopuliridis]
MTKDRPIPPSESTLKLHPKLTPLQVGDGERDDLDPEQRPGRRQSPPGRSRGGRRPPPAAADAVPTTVRFDPEESSEVDRFVLELRDDAGRRALDKSEVVRELLRMAREHEPTRRALLRRLR